jgi:hypothetical protein
MCNAFENQLLKVTVTSRTFDLGALPLCVGSSAMLPYSSALSYTNRTGTRVDEQLAHRCKLAPQKESTEKERTKLLSLYCIKHGRRFGATSAYFTNSVGFQ